MVARFRKCVVAIPPVPIAPMRMPVVVVDIMPSPPGCPLKVPAPPASAPPASWLPEFPPPRPGGTLDRKGEIEPLAGRYQRPLIVQLAEAAPGGGQALLGDR